MAMTDTNAGAANEPKRVIVLVKRDGIDGATEAKTSNKRAKIIIGASVLVLLLSVGLGYRGAEILLPERMTTAQTQETLTERVSGGLYALELAKPEGQARWMLEFDAEIVTREGPRNPLELRDALEKLVIAATSLPLVQSHPNPEVAMRKAILAMAAQDYPWLVDVHMRRSDIRAKEGNRLESLGDAMRALSAD